MYITPRIYQMIVLDLDVDGYTHMGYVNDPGWVRPEGNFDESYYDGKGNNIWIDREKKQFYEMDSSD